jgi:hypothetical protein
MELMVQVGHLASVLLESSTAYPTLADEVREEGRNFDNFGDELADCLLHGLTLTAYLSWDDSQLDLPPMPCCWPADANARLLYQITQLVVISSQILEAFMRIEGLRFPQNRQPYYDGERHFINNRLNRLIGLLIAMAIEADLDLAREFEQMSGQTEAFLEGYDEYAVSQAQTFKELQELHQFFSFSSKGADECP